MRILSIDPGYTTGIAMCDGDELEASLTVTRKGIYREGFLNHLVSILKPDVVLIEALPMNLVSTEMHRLHGFISSWFETSAIPIETIKPAQWKGLTPRIEIPGQHARDAATMASWWFKNRKIKDSKNEP